MKSGIRKKSAPAVMARIFYWILFIIYILAMIYFMFFAEELGRTASDRYSYNLQPFKEIARFVKYYHLLGFKAVMANLLGNVAAFVPFGLFLPILSRHNYKFLGVTFLTFDLSLCIELVQLVSKVGSFDVDDLILNTIGGMIGYFCFIFVKNRKR